MSTISAGNTIATSIVVTGDTSGNLVLTAQSNVVNMSTNTGAIIVPNGTTAQRPTGSNGMLRYNTTLSCFEVYSNNTWALSNVTPPPTITVAPVISGSAVVGQTVSCTTGTWTGSPTGYYYQWRANAVAISSNATSNTFAITTTQNGANLTCNVTAYNPAGNSTPSTSNSLGPVTSTYSISYLLVAGGGGAGGNGGGGGGAGGFLTGTKTLTPGTVYTATVGGGGSGSSGTNSSLTGETAAVGGGYGAQAYSNGTSGGSGGGGANNYYGGGSPGSGTSGQGNSGGSGTNPGGAGGGGGGGGGASGTGGNGTGSFNSSGGNGGSGTASSITGSSVTYAGGGGGGRVVAGDTVIGGNGGGGSGGGGSGGNPGGNGTANLGGGAGGGSGGGTSGGNGGSGVVILSVPTASYSGTTTGSPTITTSGSNTIIKFNSSGTYTA